MIFKEFLLAFRHIMRYRTYSFINIVGLSIGMACAMLIIIWVDNEYSMEKFHKNGKDIHVLRTQFKYSDGRVDNGIASTGPLAPAIINDVPEIQEAVRVTWNNKILVRIGEKSSFEQSFYADSAFFKVFSYQLIKGDSIKVLSKPYTVAISEKLAKKYFNNDNPLGKTIIIRDEKDELYTVTGVFKDVPRYSSQKFDVVLPFTNFASLYSSYVHWGNFNMMLFIQKKKGTDIKQIDKKINDVLWKNNSWAKKNVTVYTQPVEETYLYNDFSAGMNKPSGRILLVKIFSVVAIFIIFLACMNYTNLATALSIKRAKEVGIKKVFGSNRWKLIAQFTSEAVVLTVMGFILSLVIIKSVLPSFNQLINQELVLDYSNFTILGWFLLVPILTGLMAGVFPSYYLSAFNPTVVLKEINHPRKGTFQLRYILVVIQFVVTISFIICSFVVFKQIKFIQSRSLGLDKENIIMFYQSTNIVNQRQSFKYELLNQPGVLSVTYTNGNPFQINNSTSDPAWRGKIPGNEYAFPNITVDHDFAKTMGAEILYGRDLSTDYASDTNCIMINEKALKLMGFENPIGEVVNYWGRKATIVGVVKDFHMNNMRVPIQQMIIICRPNETQITLIKIDGKMRKTVLKKIENVFRQYEENVPFEYKFLDEEYASSYDNEKYMGRFSNLFSILAIVISCLGLFGLALFTAEQKTKEIGIRKSVGASVSQIMLLLARDFLKLILVAYAIACIISYYALSYWLDNYAYRTNISWWVFIITGIVTVLIALITVSWQSFRAARRNPIESLRYE
jgi:putative ABC transport system permease protein